MRDEDAQQRPELDLLAVTGLALALMFLGRHLSGLTGEVLEWRLYLILGTVFPAVLAGVPLIVQNRPKLWPWVADARRFLRFLGGTAALALVIAAWDVRSVGMAVVCALVGLRLRPASRHTDESPRQQLIAAAIPAVVLLAGCHVIPRIIYPMFSYDDGWTYHFQWATFGNWLQIPFLLAVVAAFAALLEADPKPMRAAWRRLAWVVAVIVLVAGSLRLPDFSYWIPYHHWGVFVGPVDLVRDGGLLLWDTPSQYGFLSTLTVAAVPFVDSWDAFRIVAASMLAFSAIFLFAQLFLMRPTAGGFLLALLLAFTGVLVVPGETHHLRGVFCYPSFGAYRFWPVYAFMGVALWEAGLLRKPGATPSQRNAPWLVGSVLWVIAVLWAVEASVYATAAWLPALVWSRTQLARRGGVQPARALGRGLLHAALPLGLFAVTGAAIEAWYRLAMGIVPDIRGYYEYAISFHDFLPLLIQPLGPGLVVFAAFVLISAALTRAFARSDRADLQVVALSAWGACWSAMSYFVPRSPPANATALIPVLLASLLVVWRASGGTPWIGRVPRWLAAALFAFVVFTGTYEPSRFPAIGEALVLDPFAPMSKVLPRVPKPIEALLYQAGVQKGDRIILLSPNVMGVFSLGDRPGARTATRYRAVPWLPLYPAAMSHPLSHPRWREYVDRYLARHDVRGGWYITAVRRPYLGKGYLWKLDLLMDERFPATARWSNKDYALEWRGPCMPDRPAIVPPIVPLPPFVGNRVSNEITQSPQP